MKTDKTIQYYNENAKQFVEATGNVEFHHMQNLFLDKLRDGANILDFGCGSGRDIKYFLEQGYKVDAIDGSAELCKLACELTGIEIKHMYFQELSESEKYDGIWACSSILHLALDDLEDVMKKMTLSSHRSSHKEVLGWLPSRRCYREICGGAFSNTLTARSWVPAGNI